MYLWDQRSALLTMTNSILFTGSGVIWLSAARYCELKLCNCRRQASSGTETVSTPAAKLIALVRSAVLAPHASGHASSGALLPSRRTVSRKIFLRVALACCIASKSYCRPASPLVAVRSLLFVLRQMPMGRRGCVGSGISWRGEIRDARTPVPLPCCAAILPVARPRLPTRSHETADPVCSQDESDLVRSTARPA
jgi:hypothetical protein